MAAYIPPGWPTGVHPPGSEDFEATAIAWLLDVVPPDFRLHGVLRRHPVALAAMARAGYRTARTDLGEMLPPHAIDAVLTAYRAEGRRLANTAKAVVLIEQALRGELLLPRLRGMTPLHPPAWGDDVPPSPPTGDSQDPLAPALGLG
jgi:hypothetical protein